MAVTETAAAPSAPQARRWTELLKFGVVGGVGFVTDIGVFNALRFPDVGPLESKPVTARLIAVVVATLVTFVGNRSWTWAGGPRMSIHREYAVFFVLNAIGSLVTLACLGVSHYLLELRSAAADNVASFAVGVPLGTLFRYWSYQRFVFRRAAA